MLRSCAHRQIVSANALGGSTANLDWTFVDWLCIFVFIILATSVALDEEDDSSKFIPNEFIPMGPAAYFRS